jgi:hypothetical protein
MIFCSVGDAQAEGFGDSLIDVILPDALTSKLNGNIIMTISLL